MAEKNDLLWHWAKCTQKGFQAQLSSWERADLQPRPPSLADLRVVGQDLLDAMGFASEAPIKIEVPNETAELYSMIAGQAEVIERLLSHIERLMDIVATPTRIANEPGVVNLPDGDDFISCGYDDSGRIIYHYNAHQQPGGSQ